MKRVLVGLVLLVALAPPPAESAPEPADTLAIFSTSESAWTMLKIEVVEENTPLRVLMLQGEMACPVVWGVALIEGTPADFSVRASFTFAFYHGRAGFEAEGSAIDPVEVHELEGGTGRDCPLTKFGVTFYPRVGTSYLLGYHAGAQLGGRSFVTAPAGSVRALDQEFGNDSFYFGASDFDSVLMARAPAPGVGPEEGTPGWPSQSWIPAGGRGAAIALAQRAEVTFLHHPFVSLGTNEDGVRSLQIVGPDGRIERNDWPVTLAGEEVLLPVEPTARSIRVVGGDAPRGKYSLEGEWAAHTGGSGLVAWGFDVRFPEET